MQPLSDGTLRYSPRDLIAYLEGDFAAWCDRMHVERRRAGGLPSRITVAVQPATPAHPAA
jgi:hypothetical protein